MTQALVGTRIGVQLGINGAGIFGNAPEYELEAVLDAVAAAGADGVEAMGNLRPQASALLAGTQERGLEVAAVHVFWPDLADADVLSFCAAVEAERLICSSVPVEGMTQLRSSATQLSRHAATLARLGIRLLVHNHAEETRPLEDGVPALVALAEHTSDDVGFVLDAYWATVGGADISAFSAALGERLSLLHLKDGFADGSRYGSVALGEGEVDLEAAAHAGKGCEWVLVERDLPATDYVDAARTDVSRARSLLTSAGVKVALEKPPVSSSDPNRHANA